MQDTTSQETATEKLTALQHPRFARSYERQSRRRPMRELMEPLRREMVGRAQGVVLELGAGNGLNFAFYQPDKVERVVAVEPDTTMRSLAQSRLEAAPVPITLVEGAVESLPFSDASFDCVVATLVWCSVLDPMQGLREVQRILKPGGSLLMIEHVRAPGKLAALIQDMAVPFTTRFAGNCHWNRDTAQFVRDAGFQNTAVQSYGSRFFPFITIAATRP